MYQMIWKLGFTKKRKDIWYESQKASLKWSYKANNLDKKENTNIIYMKNPWNSADTREADIEWLHKNISVNVRSHYPERLNLRYMAWGGLVLITTRPAHKCSVCFVTFRDMQASGWVTGNRNTVLKSRGSKEKHKDKTKLNICTTHKQISNISNLEK